MSQESVRDLLISDPSKGAAELVRQFGDRLYSCAFRLCGVHADAEDLVYRTFERVIAKIALFDGRSAFFTWMYSIMVNFRLMDLRLKGANSIVFPQEMPESVSGGSDPGEMLAVKADRAAIRRAVRELPDNLRIIVISYYFNEMGVADIAQMVGAPIGTVKYWLSIARRKLAEKLHQPNDFSRHLKQQNHG